MEWQARAEAHLAKERRSRHEPHPVHDFLFQYYMYSPGKLETWHPAPSESLEDTPDARERFRPPEYRAADGVIRRDLGALSHEGREQLSLVANVLAATQSRPANFGCYGVHEWAMVYRGHDIRHAGVSNSTGPSATKWSSLAVSMPTWISIAGPTPPCPGSGVTSC